MSNVLFEDTPTKHRVRKRVVYARHDWEGRFVRFVVKKTPAEIEAQRRSYLPARVGIQSWVEVHEHYFDGAP